MSFLKIISAVVSATFLATFVLASDKCYYLDGSPAGGVYRCNNATTGESSCCNAGQICYSNGVCQAGPENHATDWLRVGCTDPTWSSPACLKQCTTLVRDSSAGIRPCGGILTSDEYCCDTQGLGPGSLACCKNSSNIFAIKPIPSIIATIPLNAFVSVPSTAAGHSATSSSTHGLIPLSTLSKTSTSTTVSGSTTTTAIANASSDASSGSSVFSSSTASGGSTASSALTTTSGTTGPASATNTSSLASNVGGVGAGISFAVAAILAGLVCAL